MIELPTALVVRYRAVDREFVGAPEWVVDTPRHLDELTVDIGRHGILTPLDLAFNEEFATLDGNHRIAVAVRLGLESEPVALRRLPLTPRPAHAKTMRADDLSVLLTALRQRPRAGRPERADSATADT
jgi:ParB-like chromosome segregation protein Spo0J